MIFYKLLENTLDRKAVENHWITLSERINLICCWFENINKQADWKLYLDWKIWVKTNVSFLNVQIEILLNLFWNLSNLYERFEYIVYHTLETKYKIYNSFVKWKCYTFYIKNRFVINLLYWLSGFDFY